ncbi:uncharacterized protein LOC115229010, partial [Argonauta hians]
MEINNNFMLDDVIYNWIIDYHCDRILQEWATKFEPWSHSHLRLSALLELAPDPKCFDKELQYKLELICWLPQLFKVEKLFKEESFLETLRRLDSIRDLYPGNLLDNTADFFVQLKKQCTIVFWRKFGFKAVKDLFKALSNNKEHNNTSYMAIVNLINPDELEDLQYRFGIHLKNLVTAYLKIYIAKVPSSFLIQTATEAVKMGKSFMEDVASKYQDIQISSSLMKVPVSELLHRNIMTSSGHLQQDDDLNLKDSLRDGWKKHQQEYFQRIKDFEKNLLNRTADSLDQRGHSEVIERSDRGHSEVTERPDRGHSEVTERPDRGHSEVTERPDRGHSDVTERPDRGHSEVTERPDRGHSEVTERPDRGHNEVTSSPSADASTSSHDNSHRRRNTSSSSVESPKAKWLKNRHQHSDNIRRKLQDLTSPVDRFPNLKKHSVRSSLKFHPSKKQPWKSGQGGRRSKWTEVQEEMFYKAVKRLGVGRWADIRDYLGTERSNVNLKDKWRTFEKTGRLRELEA